MIRTQHHRKSSSRNISTSDSNKLNCDLKIALYYFSGITNDKGGSPSHPLKQITKEGIEKIKQTMIDEGF